MNKTTIRVFLAGLGISAVLCAQTPTAPAASQAPAQSAPRRATRGGTVSGSVKDDTGGIIPGATVTLTNENGTVQTVQTHGDGNYTFRNVPAGTYTVSATYSGLQQQGATMVSVTAGQGATGNITMIVQTQR